MLSNGRYLCEAENAPQISEWMKTRGGVLVWGSADISDPEKTWTTPYLRASGEVTTKPYWQAQDKPLAHFTDPALIDVSEPVEVKRFRVALSMGAQGFKVKLTAHSTMKVRKEVAKAAGGKEGAAWYAFDYGTQEAVIFKEGERLSLPEWEKKRAAAVDPAK